MSAHGSTPFRGVLSELGQRLSIPMPARVRVLQELSYDLQALTDRLVADGVPLDEARRKASEAILPDEGTLRQLGRVHEPWYRTLTRRFDADRVKWIERRVFLFSMVAMVASEGFLLFRTGMLDYASIYLWPVLGIGSLALILAGAKAFELWIKRDHARMRRGLSAIMGLSLTTFLVGFVGLVFDTHRLFATIEVNPELATSLLRTWVIRDAGLLGASILLTLAGGLAWFVLHQWVTLVEHAHREVVGDTPTQHRRRGE